MGTNNYPLSFMITFFLLFLAFLIFILYFFKNGKFKLPTINIDNFETNDEMIKSVAKLDKQLEETKENTEQKQQLFTSFLKQEKDRPELKLKDICIKSSINSAYDGKQINPLMIQYVLHCGCRFLHFDINYDREESKLFIGFNENKQKISSENGDTVLEFVDAITKTIDWAFIDETDNKYKISNVDDPLFILLRLRCFKEDENNVCQLFANRLQKITEYYKKYYKPIKLTANTKISKYFGNKSLFFAFDNDDKINEINMQKISPYFNFQLSPSENGIRKLNYYHIDISKYKPSPTKESKNNFVVVLPNQQQNTSQNPDFYIATKDYYFNCVMYQYWKQDINYKKMEYFFRNEIGSGIVSLNSAENAIMNN